MGIQINAEKKVYEENVAYETFPENKKINATIVIDLKVKGD